MRTAGMLRTGRHRIAQEIGCDINIFSDLRGRHRRRERVVL